LLLPLVAAVFCRRSIAPALSRSIAAPSLSSDVRPASLPPPFPHTNNITTPAPPHSKAKQSPERFDLDVERKPRTREEMAQEAAVYRALFLAADDA
jgi:hypothetical protein